MSDEHSRVLLLLTKKNYGGRLFIQTKVFIWKTLCRLCPDAPFEPVGSRFEDVVASLYMKENTPALIIKDNSFFVWFTLIV